ncbi:hypothetical protein OBBRIDRAFT_802500 [Obba rivulosa]|uniref:Uncharacterized protein n=1 Tax=Obba rivulosa TaxID=1052685 RepID=A0A8E2DP14_9APHY|nr:hypothetical protein OBBRIDRAFT_802500 [Obba rivulosa]
MDTPVSEKTDVERLSSSTPSELCKEGRCKDTVYSPPQSACGQDPDPVEDFYSDGGRGWLVVLGCHILCFNAWMGAWGVIHDYYQQHLFPDATDTLLSTLSSMLSMPFLAEENAAGAPVGGAILSASGGNWQVVSISSGCAQIVGATVLLYDSHLPPWDSDSQDHESRGRRRSE